MAYDRKPTALETLKKVIDGDADNLTGRGSISKVSDWGTKADALAAKWATEAAAIRR